VGDGPLHGRRGRALWQEVAGLPPERIFRLGDKDNFWQMGETGPCGPCSEIHYDMRRRARGTDVTQEEFERWASGRVPGAVEPGVHAVRPLADGTLTPLPAPSIDTGAGLERLCAVLQGVDSNYKTDLFMALIERAVEVVGEPYEYETEQGVSYRVLADHARAVAFLLADGVFPTNEGRGYVLRRVLRRAVRHAWLLGRREPTLVHVVDRVVDVMGDAVSGAAVQRREHLLRATREEEQRFLDTIDSGMAASTSWRRGWTDASGRDRGARGRPALSGEDAFRLYDTFGFPLDLTELIARERGYDGGHGGFEAALEQQRERSRQDRRLAGHRGGDALSTGWDVLDDAPSRSSSATTRSRRRRRSSRCGGRTAASRCSCARTRSTSESGGQISDRGRSRATAGRCRSMMCARWAAAPR
jgi:alanyl-tRNA synthetase